jgi:hypothetical protein
LGITTAQKYLLPFINNMKTHFLIDVLSWAEKKPNGFTSDELMTSRTFEKWEKEILEGYFTTAHTNHSRKGMPNFVYLPETIFHIIRTNPALTYVLTPDALFKHIDYTELKLARETAKEAKTFSQKSIEISERSMVIAMLAVAVSVIMPLLIAWLMIQTVRLDETQVQAIIKSNNAQSSSASQ